MDPGIQIWNRIRTKIHKNDFLKLVFYLSLSVLRRAVRLCLVLLLLPLDCLAHLQHDHARQQDKRQLAINIRVFVMQQCGNQPKWDDQQKFIDPQ
jgi:hypothetical protein